METGLFINGIFKNVLEEILKAQEKQTGESFYLQPYSAQKILMLEKNNPTEKSLVILYISTTDNYNTIAYIAEIIGWENKNELSKKRESFLNKRIKQYQPGEEEIYRVKNEQGNESVNLITIRNLERLTNNLSTQILIKKSDKLPLKTRTRAGGWSEVYNVEDLDLVKIETYEQYTKDLNQKIHKSKESNDIKRHERLASAPEKPEKIQLISSGFKRNADVIVEVLNRANGKCERCNKPAPFTRKSDFSPYLEVHHRIPLSEDGKDNVDNAMALCPNCHREVHFGINQE